LRRVFEEVDRPVALLWTEPRRADHDRWVLLIKCIGARHMPDELATGHRKDMAA